MNAHESYISLETAKLLKEAGFDWSVNDYYVHRLYIPDEEKWEVETFKDGKKPYSDEYYPRPSLSVAQRWLREVKGIHVYVISYRQNNQDKISGYCYKVYEFTQGWEFNCSSYEEAQEAGIKKALEIILEKGGEK